MSPDPSGLYYANPTNPQSFNLYGYGRNNPLVNTDPTGLDCVYINNDTNAYEGFNRGDCDNSTEAKANTGHYFDGNATTLYTTTGTLQGQIVALGGTGSDGTALISNYASANQQPSAVNISTDVLAFASQQTVATHGLWTYGNYAGSGGRGVPINNADTGALMHDYCYAQNHLTARSNLFGGHNAALQACNQALCDAESNVRTDLARKSAATGVNNLHDGLSQDDLRQFYAADDMVKYFTLAPFHGNGCRDNGSHGEFF